MFWVPARKHACATASSGTTSRAAARSKRNRETGALTCEIYLSDEQRPREVDDAATLSLGHELLHCMLGDYHR
jgi:hypothetical protein